MSKVLSPETRTQRRIIDAAAQSFATRGYRDTRLTHIAAAAGVSRSTLYEYFPGKEQLLIAISHPLMDVLVAQVRDALVPAPSALEGLRNWLRTGVSPLPAHRPLLKIIHADEIQPSLLLDREATQKSIGDARKLVSRTLTRGHQGRRTAQ